MYDHQMTGRTLRSISLVTRRRSRERALIDRLQLLSGNPADWMPGVPKGEERGTPLLDRMGQRLHMLGTRDTDLTRRAA